MGAVAVVGALVVGILASVSASAATGEAFWELDPAEGSYVSQSHTMGNGCVISLYSSSTTDTAWTDLINPSGTCIGVKVRHYYSINQNTYQVNAGYNVTWAQTPKREELRYSYHWYKYNY